MKTPRPSWRIGEDFPCTILRGPHYLASEDLSDALMTEADSEDRETFAPELGDRC